MLNPPNLVSKLSFKPLNLVSNPLILPPISLLNPPNLVSKLSFNPLNLVSNPLILPNKPVSPSPVINLFVVLIPFLFIKLVPILVIVLICVLISSNSEERNVDNSFTVKYDSIKLLFSSSNLL